MELTRRNFLKAGAVASLAGAMGVATGCAAPTSKAEEQAAASAEMTDWLGSAPEIADADIAAAFDYDVVVVGGGFAGHNAAASAIDHGAASVVILEKCPTYRTGGSLTGTVNSRLHKQFGYVYDTAWIYREYMKAYNCVVDSKLVNMWVYESGAAQDWLLDKCDAAGVDYTIYTYLPDGFEWDKEIAATLPIGVAIDTTAHDDMTTALKVLDDYFVSKGGEVKYSTPAVKLVQDDTGRVTGVIAQNAEGAYELYNAAKGVILCTGDYGGNLDMCREFLEQESYEMAEAGTFYAMKSDPSTAGANTGDGHKMACWLGAKMEDGIHASMAWNTTGFFNIPFLQVNKLGERHMNEALTAMFWPRCIYRQPDHISYQITDANYQAQVAEMAPVTPDGVLDTLDPFFTDAWESDTGWVSADTLEGLAEKLGIPADTFVATVEHYNSMAHRPDTDQGKLAKYMLPLDTPPFKASLVGYGMAVTLGGVVVNDRLQVRGADGKGIPGLYAAGNTVGRRYSRYYEEVVTGTTNAFALVHGYLSAKYCMEDNM